MRNEAQTLEQTVTFTVPGFEKYIKNVAIAAYIKRAPQTRAWEPLGYVEVLDLFRFWNWSRFFGPFLGRVVLFYV